MKQSFISEMRPFPLQPLALLMIVVIAGCAYAKAKGTVIEPKLIQPNEEIVILWDIGTYDNSIIQNKLVRDGLYSKRFEICMNEYLEKTFARNGYRTSARKKFAANIEDAPATSLYVLLLRNSHVTYKLRDPTDLVLRTGNSGDTILN